MAQVTITIDGQELQVPEGQKILWAAVNAGIEIPHLCAHPDRELAFGACRLCWVEVEGRSAPITSCTEPVRDGMVIRTRTEAVDRLVRSGFQMLLSTHHLDCRWCAAKKSCGLRDIARRRKVGLKSGDLPKILPDLPIDESHPVIGLNPNRCILCGLCVWVCEEQVGKGVLDFARRGLETHLSTFDGSPLGDLDCGDCQACAEICPVGALYLKADRPVPPAK